ncbi:MAG: 2-hydroxymuconate tautomerase [Actinomycetota bacterium]|nr:2-hydroxymuconate tautomerase [Actinomycetota bacterium]
MPFVTVHMWDGRTEEQKRRLARAITDAMVEHVGAHPEHLHVAISEYAPHDWSRAGILGSDTERHGVLGSAKPPVIYGLGHLLLQTTDLAAAEEFYLGFLGLTVRKREDFRDGRPLVVTHQGLGLTTGRPDGGNPVEHVAFRARNLPAIASRAEELGVTIVSGPEPSGYGFSLYMLDPDGNKVEMIGDAPGT